MKIPIGLTVIRRPVYRSIKPLVVREPPRMPTWVRGCVEAACGLLIALMAYALVTDIADRRVIAAHSEGVALGQQIAHVPECRP